MTDTHARSRSQRPSAPSSPPAAIISGPSTPSRRALLRGGLLAAGAAALGPWFPSTAAAHGSRVFKLGVASGDPTARSVVLWTRLAPQPLDPAGTGGMPPFPIPVIWEVAHDRRMRNIVHRGIAFALPRWAHTVHVEVDGLEPDRWYHYRFRIAGEESPIGRTRTFPAARTVSDRMRFALVSCQDYQNGFFSALDAIAREDLDFVLHVGDYIYEDGPRPLAPRQVVGEEIRTLADYRNRHALYRLDPSLQAVHAAFPFVATFDDHEVEDNHAGNVPKVDPNDVQDPAAFIARRTAAYHAYYEHLPLSALSVPQGNAIQVFRRAQFGRLATFHVLDTRQFRTDQPCGDGLQPACPGVSDPAATMTGASQEAWLLRGLDRSPALWNPIAQQVMFTRWNLARGLGAPVPIFNVDAWDGYRAARQRLTDFLAQRQPANPLILSGDIHSAWAADILGRFEDPTSAIVASEFVGTSISSDFPAAFLPAVQATLPDNPHIKFFEGAHRGYIRFDVSPELWRGDYRGVESILTPTSPVSTLASFAVEAGRKGLVSA